MESIQAKRRKNKKKIAIMSGVGALTVIGTTLAYFTTSDDIINNFKTGKYQTTIKEDFIGTDSWLPGEKIDKKVIVENTGEVAMAARVRYEEEWINSNGNSLPLNDMNNNPISIIEFNNIDWKKADDGYYYYGSKNNKTKIDAHQSSTSFINSVTLNSNVNASFYLTSTDGGKTIIYESNGNGYDNATYKLTIYIDTIQYSASDTW